MADLMELAGLLGCSGCRVATARGVFNGELVGVDGAAVAARTVALEGERDSGDSGRLKGELRGDPKLNGEGFFGDVVACCLLGK